MPQPVAKAFARSLTEAVYQIRHRESKSIRVVQDELGYALGKKGGASIEYWRKGHVPAKAADIEQLAREIVTRTDLGPGWLKKFLESAGYPDSKRLQVDLFPAGEEGTEELPAVPEQGTGSRRHNLPVDPTPFIGREQEMVDIARHLADPECRILTLLGPGGIGKTRLAVQVGAAESELFPDGVFFVPLASVVGYEQLLAAIANAVGFSFYSEETAVSQLLNFLHKKQLLLILDNFEHLIDGAGLVAQLVQQAPQVQFLITSRERLNLRGEWAFQVKGLSFPSVAAVNFDRELDVQTYSAVQLFRESARRVCTTFTLTPRDLPHVVRICQLVEGIPLGIELAASWVRVLSCEGIAEEIEKSYEFLATAWRDVPERHRSLQAVFDYSWNLLPASEQEVVRNLSVFRGGFRRAAAVYVTHTSLLMLSSLVDKSFLQQTVSGADGGAERYEMHELLRLYAGNKLNRGTGRLIDGTFVSRERERVQDCHCEYYADFLHQRRRQLQGEEQAEALEAIGEELENVRAAWQWAVTQGRIAVLEKLLTPLFDFYDIRGWLHAGAAAAETAVSRLRRLHEQQPDLQIKILWGRALVRQGKFYFRLGRYTRASEVLHEALVLFRVLDKSQEIVALLNLLGRIAFRVGRYDHANRLCRESLELCRRTGYERGMVHALEILGHCAADLGEYEAAKQYHRQGLEIGRRLGNRRGIASLLNGLSYTNWRLGERETAVHFCREGLALFQEIGDKWGTVMALKNLGNLAAYSGDDTQANAYYREGLTISRAIGFRWGEAALLNNLGNQAWQHGDYSAAKTFCDQSIRIWREIGFQWGVAGSLETLGNVALAAGDAQAARSYLQEGLSIAREIQAMPLLLEILVGMANLLQQTGSVAQAREILALVLTHPALDQEGLVKAEKLWTSISAQPAPVATGNKESNAAAISEIVTELIASYNTQVSVRKTSE